uniref:Sperm acrosome associated 7 n=1 Tax=Nomascus leucogenys TaxID=61853 RepID=A0A2I3G370_NOMLE
MLWLLLTDRRRSGNGNEPQDEILVQEIWDLNKTTPTEMPSTASTLSTTIYAGIDENYQAGGSENYHELLENLQSSPGIEDKISNDEASANANLHGDPSENYRGPQVSPGSEKSVSGKEKKNSKNTQYENLSILDKILQNIGRSPGNIFRKEQQRTSAQSRSQGSQ